MADVRLTGLAPVFPDHMTHLVLGSLPGNRSLETAQYYAHPRNAFWPIMASLFGWPPDLPYQARLAQLQAQGVGLWDVIEQARRAGSLDSAIQKSGWQLNPLAQLINSRSELRVLCFNGQKAYQVFKSGPLLDILPERRQSLTLFCLPSTSPAHARLSLADKRTAWQAAFEPH